MATQLPPDILYMADLVQSLGGIPTERIRLRPAPGSATEADLLFVLEGPNKRLCELIDGTIVEKPMGSVESLLGLRLGHFLYQYLDTNPLGIAYGSDGPFRILPEQVRLPDVSVFLWESLPNQEVPKERVPQLAPDLAVEIFSEGNTKKEMQLKLRDYFLAGVKQVWIIYPKKKTAEIYSSPTEKKAVKPSQSLTGGDLLPGFEVSLAKLFETPTPKKNPKRK